MRRDFVWRCGSKGSIATAHLRVPQRVGFETARGLSLRRADGLAPKKRLCLRPQDAREGASPDGEDASRLRALVAPSNRPEGTRPEVLNFARKPSVARRHLW
jgi:hypothetical protein